MAVTITDPRTGQTRSIVFKEAGPTGRPRIVVNDETRMAVETLAGLGCAQREIAKQAEIDEKSLRRHFAKELEIGPDKANTQVAATLFRMATSGKHPGISKFWAMTRMGWRETAPVEDLPPIHIVEEPIGERTEQH